MGIRTARLPVLAWLALLGGASALAGEPPPPPSDAVYEVVGPHHPGSASIPWHARYSPDGKWLAIVEGYMRNRLQIYDATTRALVWSTDVAEQPASLRPVFSRDGERLLLVEGTALVVRIREADGWQPRRRIPLGADPGTHMDVRPIALSPDGSEAALCFDGGLVRVGLGEDGKAAAVPGVRNADSAGYGEDGSLRVTRWGEGVAETILLDRGGRTTGTLPFAVLAASPDGKTWLAARRPTAAGREPLTLDVVDAETRRPLGTFVIDAHERRELIQVEFTPDSRHLVVIERLNRMSVRDARSGRLLQWIREYEGDRVIGFAITPDGRFLMTGGRRRGDDVQNRAVLLWQRRGG